MKRLPLLSLSLVAALGVACSSPSQQDSPAPTQPMQMKKRTQALTGVTLQSVEVGEAVQAAAGGEVTVHAFRFEMAEGTSASVEELVQAALEEGGAETANLPWEVGFERDQEETRVALKHVSALVDAIEAQVGTGEQYRSGYRHWFQQASEDVCSHGDFYGLVFQEAKLVFVIEAAGNAEC
jgi:hypothetical protein